jgi:hypothetical protein
MTLVEVTITLILVVAISSVVMGFSVDKIRQSTQQTIKYNLLSDAEKGLNTVTNDIRLSSRADDANRWQDNNAPLAPGDKLSWKSNASTLVLAVAAQKTGGIIIFDDVHNYVSAKNNHIYYLKDKTLYRRTLAAPVTGNTAVTTCPPASSTGSCPSDKTIMENVTSFSISYYDGANQVVTPSNARSVSLSVAMSVNRYGQDISVKYTTRMVFRNG